MAGSDYYFRRCCLYIRPYVRLPFSKSLTTKQIQERIVIATGWTLGLAEWIIDDTCLAILYFSTNKSIYVTMVAPTDLRMNDEYIFWYNNMAKLIITGFLPFFSLCIFNTQIYKALRRRRTAMGPNAAAAHAQQLNEDNRQVLVLFSIVIIFVLCNVPRIALNLHEVCMYFN